jgi:diguanylate cyclase (GGDEF)-like protein
MFRFPRFSSPGASGADAQTLPPGRLDTPPSRGIYARLGLPRLHLATKLYGAIALTLAVVYILAAATTQFAGQTAEAVTRFRAENFIMLGEFMHVEVLLDQHRRTVTSIATAGDRPPDDLTERTLQDLGREITALLAGLGYGPAHRLSEQLGEVARQAKAATLARQPREQLAPAAGRYTAAIDGLKRDVTGERLRRAHTSEAELDGLAAHAHSLITWVSAAAAATGLLIGPIGLFFLHRVLSRLQGIGSALLRLARNDTSVDIPGLSDLDEVGQLARSVAVFKAKSIELLQKKSESERLNLQLDAAINNMPLGLSMFDAQERLLVCNKRFAEMYDLPGELTRPGAVHCAVWDYKTKKGARQSSADLAQHGPVIGSNQPAAMTIEFGDDRIISVSRQPLKGGGWVALHEDITLRRRQEDEITHLARHDPLTSLANRVLFREQLQQALQRLGRGQGFAVLCLDLDHFKSVNDTLGHPVGDALLKQVSERLTRCVRHGDLVARLGGDEFAIIQANARDPDQTETLAERIVETISKPYEIDGHRVDIGASVGMTLAPRDGHDADQLMKNADLALYRTKSDGRNGFSFFKPEMNNQIQVRRTLEVDLRRALEQEELELYYQPIVSLQTQAITGFEALMRWQHPVRGSIPPSEFIAVAEEMGLIGEIGAWALQQACSQAARWPVPVKVAINLSPLQIRRNLIETVLQALASSGLPPERLELEITESVLLQDSQNTLSVLHQLRQLGVGVCMDDFGTGYCSLSYLRSFPFDKIKIDRAFISGIEHTDESRAIVETVVSLGNRLGMITVAEGIETFEQLKVVRECGCGEAQGYVFSPAIAADKVARFLQDGWEKSQYAA